MHAELDGLSGRRAPKRRGVAGLRVAASRGSGRSPSRAVSREAGCGALHLAISSLLRAGNAFRGGRAIPGLARAHAAPGRVASARARGGKGWPAGGGGAGREGLLAAWYLADAGPEIAEARTLRW